VTPPADIRDPYRIAADTWVIPEIVPAGAGQMAALNSMAVTGAEPVLVDTGNLLSRREWLDAAFSIIEPADVRWVFLSHDDHDHSGNLPVVMELCPNATLIATHFTVIRLSREMDLPLHRMRWINPGERFDAGDRELVAVRPPVFDSPVTRGLFDPRTGVYWAADAFAAATPGYVTDAADVPFDEWKESLLLFNRMLSPWHTLTDAARWSAHVRQSESLGATVVAAGHTPALHGERLHHAWRLIHTLTELPDAPLLGQPDLDQILAHLVAAD
jgi:flavorubredoxin